MGPDGFGAFGRLGRPAASRSFGHSMATSGLTSARASTSSTVATGMISRPFFTLSGISGQILLVLLRDEHRLEAAAQRRQQLLLEAADRQHAAAQA